MTATKHRAASLQQQSYLLAPEWSWALSEVCEMPEALHPTHDSQVG